MSSSASADTHTSATAKIEAAVAASIRAAKEETRLTQREIGERVGVDQTVVSNWVRGTATPSLPRLIALDLAFGLEPGDLLRRSGVVAPTRPEVAISEDPEIQAESKRALQAM